MKFLIAITALIVTVSCHEEFEQWKLEYGKSYAHPREEQYRLSVFKSNLEFIEKHNARNDVTFTVGLNEFADLTAEEFKNIYNGYKGGANAEGNRKSNVHEEEDIELPKDVDWRKKGYVTPVKNQGNCGSCWAFSTTGSLEGQHFKKTGKLVSLSEQNLIDCSTDFGNNGCEGGLMDNAFNYVQANKGIDTEGSYPYLAHDEKCKFAKSHVGATDDGHVDIKNKCEPCLQHAIATVGPISVAIDAGHSSFQLYKKGIYYEPDCSQTILDHGVLAVGYGSNKKGKDYWLVKNSWGSSWGENGYIKMSRNRHNNCGIASKASYPTV